MPIRDIQRRFRLLGRLRTGAKVPTKSGKLRPDKLPRYRITSPWKDLIEAAAKLYGGTVQEWEDAPGKGRQWEVIVDAEELDVAVPPGEALSQWYELWSGGGCKRRCDGITQENARPCACPEDLAERAEAASLNPPEACKPTTRLSLMLPRIADLGVWRVDAHGYNAAAELGGAAELLENASKRGVIIPAGLRLEHRSQVKDGQTRHFAVPALSFRYTLGETLQALGMGTAGLPLGPETAELPEADVVIEDRPALDAGGPAELPEADTDFGVTPAAEEPKLPTEPDEPAAFVPPEPERADEEEGPTYTGGQMLAMRAREAGLDDTRRHALIAALTGGRTKSSKDLDGMELNQAMALVVEYARGGVALRRLDDDGKVGAAIVKRDGTIVHATDPDLVGKPWREEPISAPETPGGGTPARQATKAAEASEEPTEAPSTESEGTEPPEDAVKALRSWTRARRLKVGDVLKAAAAVAPKDRKGKLPGTYAELVAEPELLAAAQAHLEESAA